MIKKNTKLRIYTSAFLFLLFFLIQNSNLILIYTLIIFAIFSILEFLQIYNKIFTKIIFKYFFSFLSICYIFLFCYLFFFFANTPQLKLFLYTLLIGCIASDVGGFLIGKIFKGPKITKISPNKTYSGAVGSILFSCAAISLSFYIFTNTFTYIILILSIFTSLGCQLGDLFFSYLKRLAKIKDTGKILPGHGGILDRIDGLLLGIPIGFCILILFYS